MTHWDNASTKLVQEQTATEYDTGMVEGYETNVNQLPEFYFRPYSQLTARQRAYIVGREIRLWEMAEAKKA